jgi:hypothetical protein
MGIHTTITGIHKQYINQPTRKWASHQNIESKNEILIMHAKLHFISKNIIGETFKIVGIKKVGCHLVLNLECWSSI